MMEIIDVSSFICEIKYYHKKSLRDFVEILNCVNFLRNIEEMLTFLHYHAFLSYC